MQPTIDVDNLHLNIQSARKPSRNSSGWAKIFLRWPEMPSGCWPASRCLKSMFPT